MRALRLHSPGQVTVDEIPTPAPGAGEVLLRSRLNGVCGTDLLVYTGGYRAASLPLTLGHEFVGEVAEVGEGVSGLEVGTRATVRGSWPCGTCAGCRSEKGCLKRSSLGRTTDGTFADFVVVPAQVVHPVPDHVTDEAAQAFITVATASKAVSTLRAHCEGEATVVGTGHSGMLMVQMLADGPRVVGTRANRLRMAMEAGASQVFNVRETEDRDNLDGLISAGGLTDCTIEATGTGDGLGLALGLTRGGGTVVIYSIYAPRIEVDHLDKIYARELTLVGSRGGEGYHDQAMHLLSEGSVDPSVFVAEPVELADAPRLLADVVDKRIPEPRPLIAHRP